VNEARRGVLEFLLADHPLDCPICDQAGDCKLQDYYEDYGLHDSQFLESKERRGKKTELGPTLIHDQERCVLCRRCVRFLKDVTQTQELGVFERSVHAEINIQDGIPVDNNYAGNLAEICPVGAITDTDFRFQTRNWFLSNGSTICPHCSRGCNITLEYNTHFHRFPVARRVFRVKSRFNPDINGYWICDLGRYGYKYLDENRMEEIRVREGKDKLVWQAVAPLLAEKLNKIRYREQTSKVALILNTWLSNEELFLVKKIFCDDLEVNNIFFADPEKGPGDDILLRDDRAPNGRGAREMGFELNPVDMSVLAENTDILLIFGPFLSDKANPDELKTCLEKIETTVLLSSNTSELDALVDVALPMSTIAEKSGSLTNCDGIIQRFSPILTNRGNSCPEWQFLVDLGREIGSDISYFNQFTSTDAILEVMGKEFSFFEMNND
jgi:NADH-quinone oxidoreductase subunit G